MPLPSPLPSRPPIPRQPTAHPKIPQTHPHSSTLSPAIQTLAVHCETQAELDGYWTKLTAAGGSEIACGWLTDKFRLTWQIVPTEIYSLVSHPAAMRAMMTMKKLDIATLQQDASPPE